MPKIYETQSTKKEGIKRIPENVSLNELILSSETEAIPPIIKEVETASPKEPSDEILFDLRPEVIPPIIKEIETASSKEPSEEILFDLRPGVIPPIIKEIETASSKASAENIANFARLRQYQKQFTDNLLMLIEESELEYGFDSPLDFFLRDRLAENALATKEWVNSLFIQHISEPAIATGILRTIAHLDYSEITPQGPTMALAALANPNSEVRECGIRALENWHTLESLRILKTVRCQEQWLKDYVAQVISDLEKELGA